MNAYRFNGCTFGCLVTLFIIFCSGLWLLGDFNRPVLASDRITGEQAIAKMSAVLGTPEAFAADMKESVQDFITDPFGSLAVATAFGIAIKRF
jgi:hypothetical protein